LNTDEFSLAEVGLRLSPQRPVHA